MYLLSISLKKLPIHKNTGALEQLVIMLSISITSNFFLSKQIFSGILQNLRARDRRGPENLQTKPM